MQDQTSAPSSHLSIRGIEAGYGQTRVLDGIDLAIPQGQFVALLGSSGCGKTTLLRAIAGFETPRAGRILRRGADITHLPPDRRGMAMVFQSYALWPHKTVAQHIAYGPRLRRRPAAEVAGRVAEMQAMLGLEGLGDRRPAALSGGQRQRVALGRALADRPEILLLDEPLSNLDARIRLQLRSEIRALQQRLGITAIHVTHDREEAMVMADRIVILNAGRVMQDGSPQQVYDRPASAFVAAFMGAENSLALEAVADGTRIAGDGTVAPFAPATALPAGPVEARFRPTGAMLHPAGTAPAPGPGTLVAAGHVIACSYPGGGWQHLLRLGAAEVSVVTPAPVAPGTPVELHVPPEALFLFPAGAAGAPNSGSNSGPAPGSSAAPQPAPRHRRLLPA